MVIHSFGGADGQSPFSRLVLGGDGMLYGATAYGGTNSVGAIFKLKLDGSGFTVLHNFGASAHDGANVFGDIALGSDGYVYGTTTGGGLYGAGTVFKADTNGVNCSVIYSFTNYLYGNIPYPNGVLLGRDGWLYGTATGEGENEGFVFKLSTAGGGFAVLPTTNWIMESGLCQGKDGTLYGTAVSPNNVFKISPDGSGYKVLHLFDGTNGTWPQADLIQGADGALYGTTLDGGTNYEGTIYRLTTDGSQFTVLYCFSGENITADNDVKPGSLLQGADGRLYGLTGGEGYSGLGDIFSLNTNGSNYKILWKFGAGTGVDGSVPPEWGGLVQDRNGVFYGATWGGGASGDGTVFRFNLPPAGYSILTHFGMITNDAEGPTTPLVQSADGLLYGTSDFGGTNHLGTVFKLNTNGSGYAIIHGFGAAGTDGQLPNGLRLGGNGVIFGTTSYGGSQGTGSFTGNGTVFSASSNGVVFLYNFVGGNSGNLPARTPLAAGPVFYGTTASGGSHNLGTVFRLNTNGASESVLYNFGTTLNDGSQPGGLVLGSDGVLYGAAYNGGSNGVGTLYKVNTNGQNYALLRQFATNSADGSNGWNPSDLIQASDGALYGTTEFGGSNRMGTVFKLSTTGAGYTVLHHFGSSALDGQYPQAALIQGGDGALYGTTAYGGNLTDVGTYYPYTQGYPYTGSGTLFRINPDGTGYTQLYQFASDSEGIDGIHPGAALLWGADGALYGTTQAGGTNALGTIFRLLAAALPYYSVPCLTNGTFTFSFNGTPNATYRIDVSTNLQSWASFTNIVDTNGPVRVTDPQAGQYRRRFYRPVQL